MAAAPDDHECKLPPGAAIGRTLADDTRAYVANAADSAADPDATCYQAGTPPLADADATNYQPTRAEAVPAKFVPRRVGDYELLEEVARGGMGVVYKARQVTLGRTVALKMILAGRFAAPGALDRFRLEARAAAALNHPCIVPIYDIGEVEGQPFFTMAFVTGGSLQQVVANGPLPSQTAARLLRRVAEAVQSAHDKGIIHRDLKPQNILLHQEDSFHAGEGSEAATRPAAGSDVSWSSAVPMLTDFGLARATTEGSGMTKTGEAMGTPSFMPPEQARGDLKAIGPCSDVYSLGAVLYCMVTGRPPFQSAEAHLTMKQVLEQEPVPPRRLNAKVPRDLETICLKCLAKEPQQRYASAGRLAEDLDCVLTDQPLRHARRVAPLMRAVVRFSRSVRRQPVRAAFVALSIFAIIAVAIMGFQMVQARRGQAHQQDAHRVELEAKARDEEGTAEQAAQKGDRYGAGRAYGRALGYYETLSAENPGRVDFRLRRDKTRTALGFLQYLQRNWDGAAREYQDAREDLEKLRTEHPHNTDVLLALAEVFHQLGSLHDAKATVQDRVQALDFYEKSLHIRKELHAADPKNRQFRRDLARSYGFKADTELTLDWRDRAWQSYDESEQLRKGLVDEDRSDLDTCYQLYRSMGNTGGFYDWTGKTKEAIEVNRQRKSCLEGLLPRGVPSEFRTDLAETCLNTAQLKMDLGTPPGADALALLRQAGADYERLLNASQPDKRDKALESSVAQVHVALAKYYLLTGDQPRADAELKTAMEPLQGKLTTVQPIQPVDLYTRAAAHAIASRLAAADHPTQAKLEERDMLRQLKHAVESGYRNLSRLERDASFAPFRESKEFQDIVVSLRAELQRSRELEGK